MVGATVPCLLYKSSTETLRCSNTTLPDCCLAGAGVNASNIKKAVDFALEQRKLGRAVLVHCAHGHGRSAGVILACMIVAGDVQTIEEGLRQIQEVRPKVKLNGMQRRNLQKYLTTVSKTP